MEEQEKKITGDEPQGEPKQEGGVEAVKVNHEDKRMIMSILAYLSVLIIFSYALAKDDPFVKYHIKQGLVLLILSVVWWLLVSLFWRLAFLNPLISLVFLVFVVLGILNVVHKKKQPLPLIGDFAKYFTF